MHVKMPIKTDKCKQKLPLLSKDEVISLREQYNIITVNLLKN